MLSETKTSWKTSISESSKEGKKAWKEESKNEWAPREAIWNYNFGGDKKNKKESKIDENLQDISSNIKRMNTVDNWIQEELENAKRVESVFKQIKTFQS